jgi:hypothetical protein
MSTFYCYDWKPTPDFIRRHHVSNLERAFERVNQQTRDWNYWCDLDGWNIGRWHDSMMEDASTIAKAFQKPELVELTKGALVIFSAARLNHIDPTEFTAVIARLEEVLK